MLRLRKERLKKGLTFTDLSYEVKIHPATLDKIETQKMIAYEPHRQKLSSFSDYLPKNFFKKLISEQRRYFND